MIASVPSASVARRFSTFRPHVDLDVDTTFPWMVAARTLDDADDPVTAYRDRWGPWNP